MNSVGRQIETRVLEEALLILMKQGTIRKIAKEFGVSKSTVHIDMTKRLRDIDYILFKKVKKLLKKNKQQRHIRGGMATKRKYEQIRIS